MKHRCERARVAVYEYLDGEMTRFRRIRIWWHLRRCPPCADGYVFEGALKRRIGEDCKEQMPKELLERLTALIQNDDPNPSPDQGRS